MFSTLWIIWRVNSFPNSNNRNATFIRWHVPEFQIHDIISLPHAFGSLPSSCPCLAKHERNVFRRQRKRYFFIFLHGTLTFQQEAQPKAKAINFPVRQIHRLRGISFTSTSSLESSLEWVMKRVILKIEPVYSTRILKIEPVIIDVQWVTGYIVQQI